LRRATKYGCQDKPADAQCRWSRQVVHLVLFARSFAATGSNTLARRWGLGSEYFKEFGTMGVDLRTSYLGLELKNPMVVAACPLTGSLDSLRRLETSGAAAAVLPSLFAEQIEHDESQAAGLYEYQTESFAESTTYFPEYSEWHPGPEPYLRHVAECKQQLSIPVIGSLNGSSPGTWTRYARRIEEAGADALELNVYFVPTCRDESSETIEQRYVELVQSVAEAIAIPLAVKIGPYFSSLPNLAGRLVAAGANGLVLFNRYLDPDLDTETMQVVPQLVLSDRHELRLSLRWIATLRDRWNVSLAATSGIHFSEDVVKALLVGADVAMVAAALMRYGPTWLETILTEVTTWLENKEYASISQLKGSMSLEKCEDPGAYHRGNYMKALTSYSSNMI
jgi:dihydroorotate dehydrogenase (fumarate)